MADEKNKDDKTEAPTQRRIEQAVERGDVAKSQELLNWFMLGAGTLSLMAAGGPISSQLNASMRGLLERSHEISVNSTAFAGYSWHVAAILAAALAIPFLFGVIAAIGGNLIQHAPLLSSQALAPKVSRLSPMSGLKRIMGKEGLVNFTKGLLKITIVGAALWFLLRAEAFKLDIVTQSAPAALLPLMQSMVLKMLGAVLAIFAFVALADFAYQRFTWMQRLKMTKQEIKEEFKETEGSPEIKKRIREIRNAQARRRMMAAVPKASVVITNPTHYAVALRYERGMAAPICVAKGADLVALKIREIAGEHRVPIVENPPLARALHKIVEVDDEVPEEHYKAVAEVIGYVMRLRGRRA